MTDVAPWMPLTVSTPSAPEGRLNNARRTSVRLARNVAVLFGIDVPDSASGSKPRMSDYNALTSADVGRGAPPDATRPDKTPIASATLSKFGPETKAALVLTGSNELFASVEETMREVLGLVGQSDDARPLADSMRITAWAAMLLDVYEAQPALLVAAFQARAIQRAALIDWAPWVDEDAAPSSDSIEFGTSRNRAGHGADRSREAKTLDILDGLMQDEVKPLALKGDYEANNPLLADDLVDRFASQWLRGSMETGLARLTVDEQGKKRIDVALPRLSLLVGFTEANMQTYHMVAPYKESGRNPGSRDDREAYDPENRDHWRRLLPRIPTTAELARQDTDVAYAAIRTLTIMLRVLRVTRKGPREMRTTCRARLGELATLAEAYFGTDSYPALEARAAHLAAVASDLRYRKFEEFDNPYESTLHAGKALFDVYTQVRDRYRDVMNPGAWLEFIDMVSARIDAWAREIGEAGDLDQCRVLQRQLCDDWEDAFTRLGIDPLTRPPHVLIERCKGLASHLHDWLALAIRMTDDPKLYSRALLIAREVVVPMRRELAIRRGNDRPYRRTLEEVALGICDGLASLPPGEAADALDQLAYIGRELRGTSRVEQLLGYLTAPPGSDLTERDAVASITLAQTYVTLDEHNMTPNGLLAPDEIGKLLDIAHSALSEVAEASEPKRSRIMRRLDQLETRRTTR
ncbi:MAG TPA: hypothetical protein VEX15_22695 [Nocardioidaceae bacterium]|nr:hypothetical protein [Nocardioidaceae bacterium]